MLSRMHEKVGTAGFVLAIVALVMALTGGAYAAQQGLNGKQKKQVKNIAKAQAKKFAKGVPGPQGLPGAPGPVGPAGAKGDTGATGPAGGNGASPTGTAFAGNQHGCTDGGIEVKGANTTYICNGADGEPGEPGQPWTAGGTLPSGETETGVWGSQVPPQSSTFAPFSFPLPLPAGSYEAVFVGPGVASATGCPGRNGGVPQADSGKLCIYAASTGGATIPPITFDPSGESSLAPGMSLSGALLPIQCTPEESVCTVGGIWAVTAL